MPTVTVTFVKATFVLATFVHIRNVSAVTDPILSKRFGPNFSQALTFLIEFFWDPIKFLDQQFCEPKIFGPKYLIGHHFFSNKFFWTQIFWDKHFLYSNFFRLKISSDSKFCWTKFFFWIKEFWVHKFLLQIKFFLDHNFFQFFLMSNSSPTLPKSTRMKCTTDLEFGTKTSPTIPGMITHHPRVVHPPSQGCSPTTPRIVSHPTQQGVWL